MRKIFFICVLILMALSSCRSGKTILDTYVTEERSLNVTKITDEKNNMVVGVNYKGSPNGRFVASVWSGNKKAGLYWLRTRLLDVSPDGGELAYLNASNKQKNIMIRRASAQSADTQRTFRNISNFSWGSDGKLYFADLSDDEHSTICSVDSHIGNLIRQHTSNNEDYDPVLSADGKLLFFTRVDNSGPSIWSINLQNGSLTMCAIGYCPCIISDNPNEFLCVRNNEAGNSEIWRVDYVLGQETLILSDKNMSFSCPSVSPDGQWIVCEANTKSSITKKNNLDLFAVRTDGTGLVQLTYHPAMDCSPVFSKDGRRIYFISDRATKKQEWNVWSINFAGL
ncbi:MAG: PD40 domain-containing protein [Muribaculaceae bacterium]|nr:PD40 domain-containing protein [Muribaculaceae bacterium]